MCKYVRRLIVPALMALIVLPASEAQAAPDTECRDTTIGAVVIEGKIVVPDGAHCTLEGTTVDDTIVVGVGSTLIARGIETLKPGTTSIQAKGATRIEVTGLEKFVGGELDELQSSQVHGSLQAVDGGTVTISNTILGGAIQIVNNSGPVLIRDSSAEGSAQLAKNKGGLSVTASFLGEGVEISETVGDVTFTGNTTDESDLTISKTDGKVTVQDNPSLGENFEVSETSGLVSVLRNTINDNVEISVNSGGAIVSGNTVGDNLSLSVMTGGPLTIVGNTVGDNVVVVGSGGEVTFTDNVVEGAALIAKTTGQVTANNNWIGYQPPEPPEPGAEPAEPVEVASGGSLTVSEASEGATVRDNAVTDTLAVTENLVATTVSDNTVRVGITVSKNRGETTEVSANQAGGDIECKDNVPPASGAGGSVAGNAGGSGTLKGECAGP